MKNTIKTLGFIALFTLGIAGSATALTIPLNGSTDVGDLDTLKWSTYLASSGEQDELNWANPLLQTSYTIDEYFQNNNFTTHPWYAVNENPDYLAYDLQTNGGYFLIKTGNILLNLPAGTNGNPNGPADMPDYFLFENGPSSDWAVISLEGIALTINEFLAQTDSYKGYTVQSFNITKISHIGEFGAPVPEPATMLLFGAGLAGLAGVARRKKKD